MASLSGQQADLTAQKYLNLFQQEWRRDAKSTNTKLQKIKDIIAQLKPIAVYVLVNAAKILKQGTPEFNEIFLVVAPNVDKQQVQDYHPTDPRKIRDDIQLLSTIDDPVSIPRPILMEFRRKLVQPLDTTPQKG